MRSAASFFPTTLLCAKLVCEDSPLRYSAQIHLPNPQQTRNYVNTEAELLLFPGDV